MSFRAIGRVRAAGAIVALLVLMMSCRPAEPDPRCSARDALHEAVAAVGRADAAERVGDVAAVRAEMTDVSRLVRTARTLLGRSPGDSQMERRLLEAAEYLDFIAGDYEATGVVDGALAQFASREINRAPDPGEPHVAC